MKQSNDIYFITLIDLLVQTLFLGLLLYVFVKAGNASDQKEQLAEKENMAAILKASGVSNLAELTDELTKLAPIRELKGTADFINRMGGIEELKKAAALVAEAGGSDKLSAEFKELKGTADFISRTGGIEELKKAAALVTEAGGSDKLSAELQRTRQAAEIVANAGGSEKVAAIIKKFEEGSGKPPCLYTDSGGKKIMKPLATVVADDTNLIFQGSNRDLDTVLSLLGKSYAAIENLPFAEFSRVFAPLVKAKPDCRYTLRLIEKTELVHARDAARNTFYLSIGR